MRTCYFATDTQDDQARWVKALTLAATVQTDTGTDYNRNESSGGFNQSQHRLPSHHDQVSDQNITHPKALDAGGFEDPHHRNYSPILRHSSSGLDRSQLPQDRNYSPNLESTRIGERETATNQSQAEDTGGFGEPRLSPRDRFSGGPGGFGSPQDTLSSGSSPKAHEEPNKSSSSNRQETSQRDEDKMATLSTHGPNRQSYGTNPRNSYGSDMRYPAYEPISFQQPQNTRNSFGSHDPRSQQDPRRSDISRPRSAGGSYRGDPRDSGSYTGDPRRIDQRVDPRAVPGYRSSDLESISSRGSHRGFPMDQNHNMPKAVSAQNYAGPPGQFYTGKATNGHNGSNNNTLEQSSESMENTLDRSFDNSRQLPGYDSFRKEKPDPALFRRPENQTLQRESSMQDMNRTDSLRRLQEWTKSQAIRPRSRPSSSYSNASDRPLSDGRRIYTSTSNPPSERSSMRCAPRDNSPPGQNHRSPPPEPLSLGGQGQNPDSQPSRPPIPAAYREQYIKELADTKTPHTRNDLLSSIEIQRLRQHEPLVFQYPEVSPPAKKHEKPEDEEPPVKESRAEPVKQPIVETQAPRQQQEAQQKKGFQPTKSWDDLNALDNDSVDEKFKYNRRIDMLLQEKRQIEGHDQPRENPRYSQQNFPPDSRQYMDMYVEKYGKNDGHIQENPRTGSFRFIHSPEKPIRRTLEEDFPNQQGDFHKYGHRGSYSTDQSSISNHHGRENSRQPNRASSWAVQPNFDLRDSDASYYQNGPQRDYIAQSERDLRNPRVNGYAQRSPPVGMVAQNGYPNGNQRLTQSLGNLHVDVGDWPENALAETPQDAANRPQYNHQELPAREQQSQSSYKDQGPRRVVGSPRPQRQQFNTPQRNIDTIKEDPNMSDKETLATKTLADLQQHLSGHRMRLSIAAGDLSDKSHEELVLLLIQLRRDQAKLEHTKDFYRNKLDAGRPKEKDYKLQRKNSIGRLQEAIESEHDHYLELRKMYDELENQLEVTKPLVKLLDNMVRMGSLYGSDNLMLASQYKRHKLRPGEYTEPKRMILFSRQYQEEKLTKEQQEELRQLEADEVDLEEKLQQLYKLDRELQERSLTVMTLQSNKDRLEKNVNQLRKDIQMTEDPQHSHRLKQQLRGLEGELGALRQQLSETSKVLEEISRQDAKVENEVMLLRKKIYGMNRSQLSPTMPGPTVNVRARQKLQEELDGVRGIIDSMSLEGKNLSKQITSLSNSTPDLLAAGSSDGKSSKPYMQTDLDSGESRDISKDRGSTFSQYDNSRYSSMRETRTETSTTARDRSKSAPPPVEREILPQQDQKVTMTHVRRDQFTKGSREGSVVSAHGSKPQSHSQDQRDNIRASTGSQYGTMPRSQPTRQSPSLVQTAYQQQQMMTREVHPAGYDLQGPPSISSQGSLSRGPTRNESQGKEGVFRAQMRMVTPEPSEQNRLRGELQSSASSTSSTAQRERSLTASQQGRGLQYSSQNRGQGQRSMSYDQLYGSKPMSEVRPQLQQQQQPQQQQQYNAYRVEQQNVSMSSQQDAPKGRYFPDLDQMYEPMELSQADDNTKKYFGLVPKDTRTQTVRDVKKKESERKSRDRKRYYVNVHGPADMEEARSMEQPIEQPQDFRRTQSLPRRISAPVFGSQPQTHDDSVLKRRSVGVVKAKKAQQVEMKPSAAERLFGGGRPSPSPSPVPSSLPSSARSSTVGSQPWHTTRPQVAKAEVQRSSTVATVRPVRNSWDPAGNQTMLKTTEVTSTSAVNGLPPFGSARRASGSLDRLDERALDEEERKVRQYWADRLKNRQTPRGRFMTISSSHPTKMETPEKAKWNPSKVHSAAGEIISGRWRDDDHEVIPAQPFKDIEFDDTTIDREVLFVPEKVEIPERYIPDSETEEESEEHRRLRQEKATQIKRMLAAQSLSETGVDHHGYYRVPRHGNPMETELHKREQLLDIQKELAYQVTQKSKEVAVSHNTDHVLSSDSGGSNFLPKSELNLFLVGRDGRGYIPSLPESSERAYHHQDGHSDVFDDLQ